MHEGIFECASLKSSGVTVEIISSAKGSSSVEGVRFVQNGWLGVELKSVSYYKTEDRKGNNEYLRPFYSFCISLDDLKNDCRLFQNLVTSEVSNFNRKSKFREKIR